MVSAPAWRQVWETSRPPGPASPAPLLLAEEEAQIWQEGSQKTDAPPSTANVLSPQPCTSTAEDAVGGVSETPHTC